MEEEARRALKIVGAERLPTLLKIPATIALLLSGSGGQRGSGGKGAGGGGRAYGKGGNKSDGGSKNTDKSGRGGKSVPSPDACRRKDGTGDSKSDSDVGERDRTEVRLDEAKNAEAGKITDSVFEPYTQKKGRIEGWRLAIRPCRSAMQHYPARLDLHPNFPKNVIP